jgi:hypothetical protein
MLIRRVLYCLLNPSSILSAITYAFALCCASAVGYAFAQHGGWMISVIMAFITAAGLMAVARRTNASRPVAIKIGQNGVTTWHRSGKSRRSTRHYYLLDTRYWRAGLLMLTLQGAGKRVFNMPILIDALAGQDLRELAVHCDNLCRRIRQSL